MPRDPSAWENLVMQDCELYGRILGIAAPWRVERVELKLQQGEVHVYLAHDDKLQWPCAECGASCVLYDHQAERQWRHLDTCQYRTILHAEPPRSECRVHGVRIVKLPWAEANSRFTALMEGMAIAWLRHASQKAVAEQLRLSWDEIHSILERAVERGLARRQAEKMRYAWLLFVLWFPVEGTAQNALPPGTVIPVRLDTGLNARKSKVGEEVKARVMQDVPGTPIRAGAHVLGHLVAVTPAAGGEEARIALRFDTVEAKKQRIAVSTDLRALASLMAVEDAQIPETGPDRGTSQNAWTTEQIGGDVVYRGGGPVARGLEVVGTPVLPDGVLGKMRSDPGSPCRAEVDHNGQPQALWLFATDACGVYGYPEVKIAHAGRTDPVGEIVLVSTQGNLAIQSGSGWLLRVGGI